ncbi:MAG: hypothetical protein J5674_01465 [Candidatus Methanomethylophilaceae archaeon]|nr:hypothetical protein [Candidatus Methanomethylophilaceae archaeon]
MSNGITQLRRSFRELGINIRKESQRGWYAFSCLGLHYRLYLRPSETFLSLSLSWLRDIPEGRKAEALDALNAVNGDLRFAKVVMVPERSAFWALWERSTADGLPEAKELQRMILSLHSCHALSEKLLAPLEEPVQEERP